MSWLYWMTICLSKAFFTLLYRHKVYGAHYFRKGAAIVAANHTSYYDPPLLAISCPEEMHFLARESLFSPPPFGALLRALHTHPVSGEVANAGVFRLMIRLLNENRKMILFPEGQRSYDNVLGPIKPGITLLLAKTHAAVVPAYIHGAFAAWPRNRRFPKLWGKTACVFGSPILYEEFAGLDKAQMHQAVSERLASAILALRNWYEQGAKGSPP